jgi:hypothetical protein
MLCVEYRTQFDIDMLGAARRVMNVKHAIRTALLQRAFHRTVFPGLVTGNVVMVGDLIAPLTYMRFTGDAELALVRGVGRKNPVLRIEHDHRLTVVLKV